VEQEGDMEASFEERVTVCEMTPEECVELVTGYHLGHIVFVGGNRPKPYPVNFWVRDRTIVFRTVRASSLQLHHRAPVIFEVDDSELSRMVGSSVVIEGQVEEITDRVEVDALNQLGLTSWAPWRRDHWMRIVPASVRGRTIRRVRRTIDGPQLPYMSLD
jgi:nitroimidazol reductase NimA-like FMN-containing flavoprotein (pyridoxamine 5'-phosphate oxidase superfamily)